MATLATGRKIVQIVACLSTISGFPASQHLFAIKAEKCGTHFGN